MTTDFNHAAVKPVECLKSGYALVKDQYWLFVLISFVAMLVGGALPFGILLGPMFCGLYLCLFARMRGERVKFELLFKGFDLFKQSVLAGIIQTAPMFILMFLAFIPMMAMPMLLQSGGHRGRVEPAALVGVFAGMFVAILVGSVISLLFAFSYPLIVERNLSSVEAIKTSMKAVFANLGGMLGLFLLNFLIGILAVPLCCVGVYLVVPITMASYAMAYRSIFPELTLSTSPPVP